MAPVLAHQAAHGAGGLGRDGQDAKAGRATMAIHQRGQRRDVVGAFAFRQDIALQAGRRSRRHVGLGQPGVQRIDPDKAGNIGRFSSRHRDPCYLWCRGLAVGESAPAAQSAVDWADVDQCGGTWRRSYRRSAAPNFDTSRLI